MRFYLSDLPQHNLMPNGDMSQNSGWSAFGSGNVKCWQAANVNGPGLGWYVAKNEATPESAAGLQSATFALTGGQSYRLSLWVYPAQDSAPLPEIRIYTAAESPEPIVSGNAYTPVYNGWQQLQLSFSAEHDTDAAFLAAVYADDTLGAFYLDNVILYPATAAITQIEIMPDWNLETGHTATTTKTRTQAGRLFIYDWHHYAKKSITLDFVPALQAQIINGFWQKRAKLLFTATEDNNLYEYTMGVITNDRTPLSQYQQPYTHYFRGKLSFEEL